MFKARKKKEIKSMFLKEANEALVELKYDDEL